MLASWRAPDIKRRLLPVFGLPFIRLTFSFPCLSHSGFLPTSNMADSDHGITDTEAMGEKAQMTHEEVVNLSQLTEEELIVEKKLRRRIDALIMPLVALVYLLNYIDR